MPPGRSPGRHRAAVRWPVRSVQAALLAAVTGAVTAAALTSCAGFVPHPPAVRVPPAPTARALRLLVAEGAPGAASLATRAGPAPLSRFTTAGVADLRSGRRIHLQDHFRAGSLTKTFVATVVLQLVAEHRLSLDEPVARRLPRKALTTGRDASADLSQVTIRELLGHTSGLFNYAQDPRLARQLYGTGLGAHRFDTHSPTELLRTALSHPRTAPPGARYAYSNTNYLLLGMVIEQLTGHPYAQEVRRRIVRPLHLTGTSFPGTDPALPVPYGRAYTRLDGRRTDITALDPSRAGAAGEMIITLGDLNRFFAALLGGRLLPPRQTAELKGHRTADGAYGLGLYATRLPCGRTVWGHNGEINGSYVESAADAHGRHVLTFRLNTDARTVPPHGPDVLAAEFCPSPSRAGLTGA
ncbi:beta-lactamase family protein [Streptomyces sp. MST-110588]|nr:beta-lactamase family protein [Streptomyces sp. MST-110588]